MFEKEEVSEIKLKQLLNIYVGYNNAKKPWLKPYNKVNDFGEPKWIELGYYENYKSI